MSVAFSFRHVAELGGAKMAADAEYYRYRMVEELSAAHNSRSAAAQRCHRELADAYSERLAALKVEEESQTVQLAA